VDTEQQIALALRKARLLGQIEAQRQRIAVELSKFKKPLAAADKVLSGVQYVKERPWIAGLAAVSVVVAGRKKLFTWARRGWLAWQAWSQARKWLQSQGYLEK
jgi:hypothetical protein